jgi:hypothetical protein
MEIRGGAFDGRRLNKGGIDVVHNWLHWIQLGEHVYHIPRSSEAV